MFSYPLTITELYEHAGKDTSIEEFNLLIEELIINKLIVYNTTFLMSPLANKTCIEKRINGNKMAAEVMPKATEWALKVFKFPYVRSVSLSGSLSKNYFDTESDFDFFIVTKANRLWICRTLIILYWKLLSATDKKNLCTNYFIDETVLELEDKNRFTATELSYLIPIINSSPIKKLQQNNTWITDYINNKPLIISYQISAIKNSTLKSLIEKIANTKLGNILESYLLNKTIARWRKQFTELNTEDFELQFRTRKNVGKRHTKGFQNKVLQAYEQLKIEYEKNVELNLSNTSSTL